MRYVVAYDIEDDRVRARMAKLLTRYGVRVQKSVFECDLEPETLARLQRRLHEELSRNPGGDVRVYRACADCLDASWGLGDVEEGLGGDPWIVI